MSNPAEPLSKRWFTAPPSNEDIMVTRLVTALRRLPDLPDVAELATLASGTSSLRRVAVPCRVGDAKDDDAHGAAEASKSLFVQLSPLPRWTRTSGTGHACGGSQG